MGIWEGRAIFCISPFSEKPQSLFATNWEILCCGCSFFFSFFLLVKQVAYANNNTKTLNTIYITYNTGYLHNTNNTVLYT